ncbi:hypothetical protein Tco_1050881 [Tanacetum coccineum]
MSNTNTNLQTQTSNALHNAIMEAGGKDRPPMLAPGNYNLPYKFKWTEKTVPVAEGSSETTTEGYMENYKNVSQDIRDQLNAKAEVVQIILTEIDNDIYSIVDACPNTCEKWKAIKRFYQSSSECSVLTSITTRMAKNEVNEIRAERLARTANPLALVAQQQPVYHPQNYPNHYTQNSSTRSQQAATRNIGKAIVNSPQPTYGQEPKMVAKDDALSKEKEIDKLMALISLSFKKIYKPTNNNLRTSSSTSKAHKDNTTRINRGTGYDNQMVFNVTRARENVADWRDDTDDEPDDQITISKKYHDINYVSKVEIDCAKAKGDLMSYKMESQKSLNEHTQKINDLNQMISEMKKELFAHQETIFIMSPEKEAQNRFYKTREDKELEKVIVLENRVKVLDNIVYKTRQSVQIMNMLNHNCKTSFVKPEFLKKA